MGEPMAESDLVTHLLNLLPESWDSLASSLVYCSIMPSFSNIFGMMLQEELRREIKGLKVHESLSSKLHRTKEKDSEKDKEKRNSPSTQTRGRGKGRGRGRGRNSLARQTENPNQKKDQCAYCGSTEHWMRNCPELAAEIKQRREQRKTKKNVNLNAAKVDKGSFIDDEDEEDIDNFEDEGDLSNNLAASILKVNLAASKIRPPLVSTKQAGT
jgi:hypothetical protein